MTIILPQKGGQGRSTSNKQLRVFIAIEERDGKSGKGYAKIIENYSAESLKPFLTLISINRQGGR